MRHVLTLPLLIGALAAPAAASEYVYLNAGAPGQVLCAPAPEGWESPDFDDAAWLSSAADTRTLLVDGGVPDAAAALTGSQAPTGDAGVPGCMGLHLRRHFDVGPEIDHLAALTLRVRYQDGFVAYLNGREVARRRLIDGTALASETHGTERESFPIAVAPGLLRPTGNVLAVLVLPARPGRRIQVDVALEGAEGPRIVRGPYLQRVGTTEGWMVVETDLETTVDLAWQTPSPRGARPHNLSSPPQTRHVLHLTRLAAATTYHYRLVARAAGSGPGQDPPPVEMEGDFHTPPGGTQPVRFAIFGDVRSGHEVHAAIVRALVAEDPDLALMTGDLVDRGTDEAQWERYFDIAAPLLRQVAIYPAAGNHEYERGGRGLERFLSFFPETAVHLLVELRRGRTALHPARLRGLQEPGAAGLARSRPPGRAAAQGPRHLRRGPRRPLLLGAPRRQPGRHQELRPALSEVRRLHGLLRGTTTTTSGCVWAGSTTWCRAAVAQSYGSRAVASRAAGPAGARSRAFMNEHHYIMVEVRRDRFRLCPKRADGTLLEPCPTFPLR